MEGSVAGMAVASSAMYQAVSRMPMGERNAFHTAVARNALSKAVTAVSKQKAYVLHMEEAPDAIIPHATKRPELKAIACSIIQINKTHFHHS